MAFASIAKLRIKERARMKERQRRLEEHGIKPNFESASLQVKLPDVNNAFERAKRAVITGHWDDEDDDGKA